MCTSSEHKPIIFLHIPKNGGTSTRDMLVKHYKETETALCYAPEKEQMISDLGQAILQEKKLIYGHIDFSILNSVSIDHSAYSFFTMLRHPVDRVISNYIHLSHSPTEKHKAFMRNHKHFEDFVQSFYGQNRQCQFLSGYKWNTINFSEFDEIYYKADQNLKRCKWVGIQEEFSNSILSLSHILGLKNIKIVHKNSTADKKQFVALKTKYSDLIESQNTYDLMLYKSGVTMLNNQLKNIPNLKIRRFCLKTLGRL